TSAATPIRTISKMEIRTAPPAVTHRRLRDVVWSMFERQDYRTKERPTRPLSRLFLETETRSTEVPGLCRYDSVKVEFRTTVSSKRPTAPSKAVGLQSTSHFLFVSPPTGEYEDLVGPAAVSEKGCLGISKDRPFFTATTEV